MPALIERPEDELQHMIGRLIWENTALRYENEALRRENEALRGQTSDELPQQTARMAKGGGT